MPLTACHNEGRRVIDHFPPENPVNVMDIQTLTRFFMWCTFIDGALLILWSIFYLLAPDLVYRVQSKFIPISRDYFDKVIYAYLAVFKIVFIVFNLVPFAALLIVG